MCLRCVLAKRSYKRGAATVLLVEPIISSVSISSTSKPIRKRGWYRLTVYDVALASIDLYYYNKDRVNDAISWLAKSQFVIDDEGTAAQVVGFRTCKSVRLR